MKKKQNYKILQLDKGRSISVRSFLLDTRFYELLNKPQVCDLRAAFKYSYLNSRGRISCLCRSSFRAKPVYRTQKSCLNDLYSFYAYNSCPLVSISGSKKQNEPNKKLSSIFDNFTAIVDTCPPEMSGAKSKRIERIIKILTLKADFYVKILTTPVRYCYIA